VAIETRGRFGYVVVIGSGFQGAGYKLQINISSHMLNYEGLTCVACAYGPRASRPAASMSADTDSLHERRRRYPLAKVKGGWTSAEDQILKRWDFGVKRHLDPSSVQGGSSRRLTLAFDCFRYVEPPLHAYGFRLGIRQPTLWHNDTGW
jgi:hypothetical protein